MSGLADFERALSAAKSTRDITNANTPTPYWPTLTPLLHWYDHSLLLLPFVLRSVSQGSKINYSTQYRYIPPNQCRCTVTIFNNMLFLPDCLSVLLSYLSLCPVIPYSVRARPFCIPAVLLNTAARRARHDHAQSAANNVMLYCGRAAQQLIYYLLVRWSTLRYAHAWRCTRAMRAGGLGPR